ncbi:MAG TPA: type II secretion system inner membrane protein GspF [Rhodanobacteraceae bacterium]|nr:type II secretion system inner membrane protein GspF [Rhodanobacteraceae bacterium]
MTLYHYKAVTASGETLDGQMEAASVEEVIGKLQEQGHLPLDAREAEGDTAGALRAMLHRKTLSNAQIVQFTQQLATLLNAGQPLDRSLQILLELPEAEKARHLIERIRDQVRGGATLSDALEAEHGVFSRLYVNMVRAGEVGGSLGDTLTRLGDYLERSTVLRGNVINALIYPAFLIGMVFVSLLVLLAYVVPQFVPMFEDMGVELPLVTRIVMAVGGVIQGYWWLLLVIGIFGAGWFRRQWRDPQARLRIDERLLKMKMAGSIARRVDTARLARTLGTLLKNGVPLLSALTIARNVLTNSALAQSVTEATESVKTGGGLAVALAQSKRFPKLALQMISVGEESGELDTMLMKVADTFDIEVKNSLDRMLAALVPLTTVVMTGIVAVIMMAIILPILNLAGSIK